MENENTSPNAVSEAEKLELESGSDTVDSPIVYYLRDINKKMVKGWEGSFAKYLGHGVQVSCGDIFKGAPYADAIVSPANGFGFMDGGIDRVYSEHFGWQMQTRLQKLLREEYHGELMVGNAVIIPAYPEDSPPSAEDLKGCNNEKPIKWLISAPTMRVPLDVSDTANAYLAFRAIVLAVQKHNRDPSKQPIRSILCPGLGTAVGNMDFQICANQMLVAYETFEAKLEDAQFRISCDSLFILYADHEKMTSQVKAKMLNAYESFALGSESASFRLNPARLIKMRKDHHGMVKSVNFR